MLSQDEKYNKFVNEFSDILYSLKTEEPYTDYLFLCVGSDKITGDCYGPLVGQKLKERLKNTYQNIHVYGTLDEPISAVNLEQTVNKIYKNYKNPCIIAIDSALGSQDNIGKILVSNIKIKCGKGTNKKLIPIGDISIRGVVAKDYKIPKYNFSSLQNTRIRRSNGSCRYYVFWNLQYNKI